MNYLINILASVKPSTIVAISVLAAIILAIAVVELIFKYKEKHSKKHRKTRKGRKAAREDARAEAKAQSAPVKEREEQQAKPAPATVKAQAPAKPKEEITSDYIKATKQEIQPANDVKAVPLSADGIATAFAPAPVEQTEEIFEEEEPETEEVEAEETSGVMTVDGKQVHVLFRKSFTAKLIQSKDETKAAYAELANYALAYGAKDRLSWSYHSFNKGRNNLFRLNVNGKTLRVYFGITQEKAQQLGLERLEYTESKKYEKTPMFMRIRSSLAIKRAKAVMDIVAKEAELTLKDVTPVINASAYPYDTTENLIERELIKYTVVKGTLTEDAEIVKADLASLMREKVTAEEAHNLLDDKAAAQLISKPAPAKTVKTKTTPTLTSGESTSAANLDRYSGKRYAVNVDDISKSFAQGEIVDLHSLKVKGLIPKRAQAVKILARGTLDKRLTVYADDYSADAVKMIVLTGGVAMKGRRN